MKTAAVTRIEPAQRIRIDSTVTDSPIHAPSDSHLLWLFEPDGNIVEWRKLASAHARGIQTPQHIDAPRRPRETP